VASNREGRPIRDPASTTYTGAVEPAEMFARRIYREAYQRGWMRARLKVVLGDGAIWIWNIAEEQFPGAIFSVDFYHASKHRHQISRWPFSAASPASDRNGPSNWKRKRNPSSAMPPKCVIRSSAPKAC